MKFHDKIGERFTQKHMHVMDLHRKHTHAHRDTPTAGTQNEAQMGARVVLV